MNVDEFQRTDTFNPGARVNHDTVQSRPEWGAKYYQKQGPVGRPRSQIQSRRMISPDTKKTYFTCTQSKSWTWLRIRVLKERGIQQ